MEEFGDRLGFDTCTPQFLEAAVGHGRMNAYPSKHQHHNSRPFYCQTSGATNKDLDEQWRMSSAVRQDYGSSLPRCARAHRPRAQIKVSYSV
jgi:hypothetical protein